MIILRGNKKPGRKLIKDGEVDKDEVAEGILEYENKNPKYSVLGEYKDKDSIKKNLRIEHDKKTNSYSAKLNGIDCGWWDIDVDKNTGIGGIVYND